MDGNVSGLLSGNDLQPAWAMDCDAQLDPFGIEDLLAQVIEDTIYRELLMDKQPTNAQIIGIDKVHGEYLLGLFYRTANLEKIFTNHVCVDMKDVWWNLCNQRYFTWNGRDLPVGRLVE